MVRYCCICKVECGMIEDVTLHKIPRDEEMKQKWFIVIGREVNVKYATVCSQHFKQDDFVYKVHGDSIRRFIKPTAVPSLSYIRFDSENGICPNLAFERSSSEESIVSPLQDSNVNKNAQLQLPAKLKSTSVESNSSSELNKAQNIGKSVCNNKSYSNQQNTEFEESENDDVEMQNMHDYALTKNQWTKRRFHNRKTIGDLSREDFISDETWDVVQNYIEENKKKQRALNQQIVRLNEKVASLKAVIEHVNKTRSLPKDVRDEIEKTI
ncbi:uncharacterized protein LOC131664843 [Phymastichus coffea]|uniref:uncharacterized protein LOC131664843 n=1 Tax=Phymastichus coffea TaxID=108790 RepID=UPI00273BF321|nr:uncharacterized protein LOC131664843 [Phymastichus coffea]